MIFRRMRSEHLVGFFLGVMFFVLVFPVPSRSDVIINVLAVNGADQAQGKEINFSLPGEITPDDVIDSAGLEIGYNVDDVGYFLHGKVDLLPKESKTFRVRIRDRWQISDADISEMQRLIEDGFKEMGAERGGDNGERLKQGLLSKLDYIVREQREAAGTIDQRIDTYRNHLQTLNEIKTKASLIDYWRSDPEDEENHGIIQYVIAVENTLDKAKKFKQKHYLPSEIRPEYIADRQGYEIRYDDKKGQPFLFKEEDLAPKEKKSVKIGIKDVWFVPEKEITYLRSRSEEIYTIVKDSQFAETAKTLYNNIVNYADLIDALQAMPQPGIKEHIGAYRINKDRFDKAWDDLNSFEKLLSYFRKDLEKSRIKNVMQKIQSMSSLAKISEAIFDKKPTVNTGWKLITGVMVFLGMITIVHFITWFIRTAKEKRQEEIKVADAVKAEDQENA